MSKSRTALQSIMFSAMLVATVAFAADEPPPATAPAPSKEMREKMAAVHDAMAACLRSERTFADCRGEMQKRCQEMHGEQACPMTMGMGMRERMRKH